jgi:hypothetical protein
MRGGRRVKAFIFKFRPSSHSNEYTIVAEYSSKQAARKALRTVKVTIENPDENDERDWSSDDACAWIKDRAVFVTVYTAGYMDSIRNALGVVNPVSEETYEDYQELLIRVEVPEETNLTEAMLVFDKVEANIARILTEKCGEPETVKENGLTFLQWNYKGDRISDEVDQSICSGGEELKLASYPRWHVEWL